MGEQKWNAMKEHGVSHLKFVAELYLEQMNQGRYFLHEHPASASSWKEPEITELASYPNAYVVTADLCMYGMMSKDPHGEGLAKKPTKFLTNSACLAKSLSIRCSGDHRHVALIGGRAKSCEVYPRKLCEAMVIGLKNQLKSDGLTMSDGSLLSTGHDEDTGEDWTQYYDDMSGLPLRTDLVVKARGKGNNSVRQLPGLPQSPNC